ncbi:sulfite exporter TauE/SafE family protein [Pseudonocardia sp. KRD-182]|uniref:urease accessory protein UreH domain-containing protein n=1 Tax=Pseudonocardia oceani TaxID=2792013 RepID=UPI001C5C7F0E|nr:sulfite exporter TauE/SafE family protein [Pseudonocardia oceani]MBW0108062.1 sulfite exporter TauE/SafE family protein [Pseudonocardia oceani]
MNLTAVLVTGLFAGGVSCAAVQGGLLTGLISRQRAAAVGVPVAVGRSHDGSTDGPPHASPWHRLGDDVAPVAGFLAGKLVSHTALGALLGALGGAVQLSISTRTTLQLLAGALIIVFGLAQLGVPGFRGVVIEPPQAWMRVVRSRSRSQSALAPALLGVATVLIPCGVTLSVQALALASGSALSGAVIMAVFVLGTAPLFALLGYAARRAATAWRGRLAIATGLIVVAMGLFTLNGGLELAGSPVAASRVVQAFGAGDPEPDVSAVSEQGGQQQVLITARPGSYSPSAVQARAGVPTTLIVRSEDAQGCVRSFLIPSRGVEEVLPADGETRIDLGVLEPGTLRYSCGMGMYTGTITAA